MPLAVITGASGLLGSNLASLLVAEGFRVRALRRSGTVTSHLGFLPLDWVEVELANPAALTRAFDAADVVFHCAGSVVQSRWVRPEHRSANIDGTGYVIAAVRQADAGRLVHCSSAVTCIWSCEDPLDETTADGVTAAPLRDGYMTSKLIAETAVLDAAAEGLDAVVVNPGFMFGPLDARPSSGRLILEVAAGRAVGWPAGGNNFVDARAVAAGMLQALRKGRRGERYILGGQNLSYRDAFTLISTLLDLRPPRFALPLRLAMLAGAFGDLREIVTRAPGNVNSSTVRYAYRDGIRFSSAKAERELGYTPGNVATAIADAIAWFRSVGKLPAANPAGLPGPPATPPGPAGSARTYARPKR